MRKIAIIMILVALLGGCEQPASHLKRISLNETKEQIKQKMGDPRVVRGAIQNKYDQNIEVWEYRLAMPSDDSAGDVIGKSVMTVFTLGAAAMEFTTERRDYWLYFCDDELVRWGQAGDWQIESQNLYEVRFASGHNL